jgi:hypothetical protein
VCVVVRMEVAMEVATEGVEVRMGGRFNLFLSRLAMSLYSLVPCSSRFFKLYAILL